MMNSAEEETVVASLRERDNDLAQKIIDEMFVFDNLLDVEDRAIQLILKEIDNDTLMVALKGCLLYTSLPQLARLGELLGRMKRQQTLLSAYGYQAPEA